MIVAAPIHLGHGYTARVQIAGTERTYGIPRTLELRNGRVVVQRFFGYGETIYLHAADITDDGLRDVLAWNYTDGSGGCGTYRLYAGPRLREVYVHRACIDWFWAKLSHTGLTTWIALGWSKTRDSGTYIHCCWARWLRTERRWLGGRLRVVARVEGPPPARRTW